MSNLIVFKAKIDLEVATTVKAKINLETITIVKSLVVTTLAQPQLDSHPDIVVQAIKPSVTWCDHRITLIVGLRS